MSAAPHGRIDAPVPDAVVPRDVLRVAGWAGDRSGPADAVELRVGDGAFARARIGERRPDVAEAEGRPELLHAGFSELVDLTAWPGGELVIEARARLAGGRLVALDPVRVAVAPPAPPPLDWDARATRGRRAAHRVLPAGAVRPRNAPLRLLAGAHDLELAGAQIALATLLAALAAEGAAVSLASPRDGPLRERLEAAGVEVALVDGAALADPAAYAGDRDRLARVLAARRPDVVLANTLLAFPWVDAARRAGLPSLWWVHESWPGRIAWRYLLGETGLHPLVRRSAERALRSASALLFVARATQVLYEPWSDPLRHHTLPYGLDLAALRARGAALDRPAARAALGLDPGRPVVLSVGTVDPRKGQWLLLAALARLADRHPDAQLVLLGAHPSPYVDGVEQEAARLGVAERLRVVPPAPDPVPWYVAADLLALAADVESLPLTLIEALALEVPALATATFGTPDVVLDGETGWLVERRDVAALTRGLDAALSATAPERERRGRAGAALVTERHALAPFAREVTALLLGLAGRRSVAVAAAPAQPVAGAVGAP